MRSTATPTSSAAAEPQTDVREGRPRDERAGACSRLRVPRAGGERRGGRLGFEDYRVGRSLLIASVPLLPIIFLMELNGGSGLVQSIMLGVAFGAVAYIEQARKSRHLILTDRRLLVLGSTWKLRPAEVRGVYRRGELSLIAAEDASYGMRSLRVRMADQTEHEFRFARPSRDEVSRLEDRLADPSLVPPPMPPPPGSSGPSATLPDVPGV